MKFEDLGIKIVANPYVPYNEMYMCSETGVVRVINVGKMEERGPLHDDSMPPRRRSCE